MSGLFLYGIIRLFGVRLTSFYRTPEHNVEVGGVATSLHQYFRAADVGLETPESFLKLLEFLGFKVLRNDNGTHHHVEATGASDIFFSGTSVTYGVVAIRKALVEVISDSHFITQQ